MIESAAAPARRSRNAGRVARSIISSTCDRCATSPARRARHGEQRLIQPFLRHRPLGRRVTLSVHRVSFLLILCAAIINYCSAAVMPYALLGRFLPRLGPPRQKRAALFLGRLLPRRFYS